MLPDVAGCLPDVAWMLPDVAGCCRMLPDVAGSWGHAEFGGCPGTGIGRLWFLIIIEFINLKRIYYRQDAYL